MNILQEKDGAYSSRRFWASALFVAGIAAGVYAIYRDAVWQVVASAFAIPIVSAVFLLFFTTWTDIAEAGKVFRDNP